MVYLFLNVLFMSYYQLAQLIVFYITFYNSCLQQSNDSTQFVDTKTNQVFQSVFRPYLFLMTDDPPLSYHLTLSLLTHYFHSFCFKFIRYFKVFVVVVVVVKVSFHKWISFNIRVTPTLTIKSDFSAKKISFY